MTTCSESGCERPVKGRGLCSTHYWQRKLEDPDGPRCVEDGCEGPVWARGRCQPHYRRIMRNGASGPRCVEDGCERRAEARGLCHGHYRAARVAGITEICKVLDCDSPVRVIRWRLCSTHYQRWMKLVRWRSRRGESVREVPRSFPGLGVIGCRVCGRPVVEHDIGPCPDLDRADLHVRGHVGIPGARG